MNHIGRIYTMVNWIIKSGRRSVKGCNSGLKQFTNEHPTPYLHWQLNSFHLLGAIIRQLIPSLLEWYFPATLYTPLCRRNIRRIRLILFLHSSLSMFHIKRNRHVLQVLSREVEIKFSISVTAGKQSIANVLPNSCYVTILLRYTFKFFRHLKLFSSQFYKLQHEKYASSSNDINR